MSTSEPDGSVSDYITTGDTIVDEDPRCALCEQPAPYDESYLLANFKTVVRVVKTASLIDYIGGSTLPLCPTHFAQTATGQLWQDIADDEHQLDVDPHDEQE